MEVGMNVLQSQWIPGAELRVWSRRRLVWHYGIAGWVPGTAVHASKDRGQVALTSFDEFAEGETVWYGRLPRTFEARQVILDRAQSKIGKPFQLMKANCEDFVNWAITGTANSPQRDRAVGLAFAAAVLGIIAGL
jgi:hypothetical protein